MPRASVSEARLPNGLRVLTRTDAAAPLAVVDLWVRAGAADDGGTGAAHALEHMLFKGAKDVPAGAVDRAVEAAGGVLFAETLPDATHFWAAVPPDRTEDVLSALARLMLPPTVEDGAWERERRVMLEESARSRADPSAELRRELARRLIGLPYAAPVAGTPASLAALTPEQIRAFHAGFYRPERMTLVVVGPVVPKDVQKQVAATFASLPAPKGPAPETRAPEFTSSHVQIARRNGNRVDVGLALAAPDGAGVDVLASVLSARLSAAVAGIADTVDVSHPWQRAGMVVLAVGGPAENEAALRAALDRVAALPAESITAEEVAAAVRLRQWAWWLEHERPAAQAKALGLAATVGDVDETTAAPERLAAVTPEAVRAAARALFKNQGGF